MKGKKSKSYNDTDSSYALVYSTDPLPPKRCSGCSRPEPECVCKKQIQLKGVKPAVRIERKGRSGKSVTLITKLPAHETFLKELCAHIKKSLGTGGTYYLEQGEGVIEIHGERRDAVLKLVLEYR